MEYLFELKSRKKCIRGVINRNNNATLLIYCPGLAGDRVDCHRIPIDFARYIENKECDFIRFDYSGIGTSDGELIELGFNSVIEDINIVLDNLSNGYKNIILISISQAAIQALKIFTENKNINGLIMWSPLFDKYSSVISDKKIGVDNKNKAWDNTNPELYKGDVLASKNDVVRISRKFIRQKSSGLLGYPNTGMWYSRKYYAERNNIIKELHVDTSELRPIICLCGENDDDVNKDILVNEIKNHSNVDYIIIPEGDHLFSTHELKHKLFLETSIWINRKFI